MQMNVIDPPVSEDHEITSDENDVTTPDRENGNVETSHGESTSNSTASQEVPSDAHIEETIEMLGKLPPEIGMLLVLSGIAGILLPGPVGTPLLIAGGVTMWPKTFQPIERWFSRRFPQVHREGVHQIKGFVASLQNRFPEQK